VSVQTRQQSIQMTLPSDPRQICVARRAVEAFAAREGFWKEQAEQIGLALNEALANVIAHGYGGETDQVIVVSMEIAHVEGRRCLRLVVRDYGRHVDPECIKSRDLDEVRPGGLGVHIIKTVMDRADYRCISEGGMELTMLKFADEGKRAEQ